MTWRTSLALKAHPVELVCDGLGGFENRPGDEADRPDPALWVCAVVDTEAGVDEDEAVVGFQEQDMAYAFRALDRVHGAAVEMVDLHRLPRSSSASVSPASASISLRPICVTRLAESK